MRGDALPDTDHVSRYCKPSTVLNGEVQLSAFLFRDGEDYLSVNWLEYLKTPDLDSAIYVVKETLRRKGFDVRPRGLFAVLNVGDIKEAIHATIKTIPRVEHLPSNNDASHAGISGYSSAELAARQADSTAPEHYDMVEAAVAAKVALLLSDSDTYTCSRM